MLGQLITAALEKIGLGGPKKPEQVATEDQPSAEAIAALKELEREKAQSMSQAAAPVVQNNTAEIQSKIDNANKQITDLENQAKQIAEQTQKEIEALQAQTLTTANPLPQNPQGDTQSVEQMLQQMGLANTSPVPTATQTADTSQAASTDMSDSDIVNLIQMLGMTGGEQNTPAAKPTELQTTASANQTPTDMNNIDMINLIQMLGLGAGQTNESEPAQFKDLQTLAQTPTAKLNPGQKEEEQKLLEQLIPQVIMQSLAAGAKPEASTKNTTTAA